jgi:hypothetical protein
MSEISPEIIQKCHLILNSYTVQTIRRMNAGMSANLDNKRKQSWCEYGYPESIDGNMLYSLWDRTALAYGAIAILHEKCWEDNPQVLQGKPADDTKDMTPWDNKTEAFLTDGDILDYFSEADMMRMVGGWSGLIIQYQDGGKWDEPVTATAKNVTKLIPAWATQLTPQDIVTDDQSPLYGEPGYWAFNEGNIGLDQLGKGAVQRQIKVHPDRILILGDWRTGRSELRAAYNNFVNTEKIEGGSGESFLKNASRQIALNYDKDADLAAIASAHGVKMEDFQSVMDDIAKGINQGIDSVIMSQGATASTLVASVPDPKPHYDVNIQSIAAAMRIPAKVLVGMQTGERASSEDLKQFNKRCQGRRNKVINKDLRNLIKKFASAKAIDPVSQFYIKWNDLSEATTSEKLDNAAKMADINQKNQLSGPTFSQKQIVNEAGMEVDEEMPPLPEQDDEPKIAEPVAE